MKSAVGWMGGLGLSLLAPGAGTAVMVVAPDRINCRDEAGETARRTVCAEGTNGVKLARGVLSVRVDNFGNREILTREIDLAKENPFQLSVTRDAPGFIRLGVTSKDKPLAGSSSSVSAVSTTPASDFEEIDDDDLPF